jgi:hypothetical protein
MYYPDRADFGSYIVWDQQRLKKWPRTLIQQVEDLTAQTGKDAILVLNHELAGSNQTKGVSLLCELPPGIREDEKYWIYRWPCAGSR